MNWGVIFLVAVSLVISNFIGVILGVSYMTPILMEQTDLTYETCDYANNLAELTNMALDLITLSTGEEFEQQGDLDCELLTGRYK